MQYPSQAPLTRLSVYQCQFEKQPPMPWHSNSNYGSGFMIDHISAASQAATLAVVSGRRRIGKSRLIEEFAKDYRFLEFAGIPPDTDVTAQDQRDVFAHRVGQTIGLPSFRANDGSDLFQMLAEQTRDGRVIILLDEISWMAIDDPTFLGKLKIAWDMEFKKNPQLILIICVFT